MSKVFRNPILAGFYPDPSICRVGEEYYLVASTFEYFPGLPIFNSRDLIHWQQIGHVIDRTSQLPLTDVSCSSGLYAATIRFHAGQFYVINTLVGGKSKAGNFIVTATNPAGPWSDPHWLDEAPGIDPSLFFDEDGSAWYVGNRMAKSSQYDGHTEIWLREVDLATMQLKGETYVLWDGANKRSVWAEAPHIYKVNGRYYLMIAEGGTSHDHAVTVARSASLTGPYEPNMRNPILTHRHLGMDHPIVGAGHADLVDTPKGEWWLVCLAMRPYGGYFYNLGRETFLVPVRWEEDWPVINPGRGQIDFVQAAPDLSESAWPHSSVCDHFDAENLAFHWNSLRTSAETFASLTERPGHLRLRLRAESLSEEKSPSFLGRRQQHINFHAAASLEFSPRAINECAGLALIQNNNFYYLFVVTGEARPVVQLIRRERGVETILAEKSINTKRLYLKVESQGQAYSFFVAEKPDDWENIAENIDGRLLSTPVAGGYVGAYIGMYASSNGKESSNCADFDWFEYCGLD